MIKPEGSADVLQNITRIAAVNNVFSKITVETIILLKTPFFFFLAIAVHQLMQNPV